jgi:uncharacterized membrane protein YgdD (TMEM256/DUF423 family)
LYLLTALKATKDVGLDGFGILTPLGGLLLVAGWICFFLAIPAERKSDYKEN